MSNIPFRERISCTVPEACVATGLGRTKLYEEIAAGRIETCKVGKRVLVLVSSLENLVGTASRPAGLPGEASAAVAA
jgi:excisionase family DNA binding protein